MPGSPRVLGRLTCAAALCVLTALLVALTVPEPDGARRPVSARGGGLDSGGLRALVARPGAPIRAVVARSLRNDTSASLRRVPSLPPSVARAGGAGAGVAEPGLPGRDVPVKAAATTDPVVQSTATSQTPAPALSIRGIGNADNPAATGGYSFFPPDVNGDVGAGFFVEVVNGVFAVYRTEDGSEVYGPAAIDTVWAGFGGLCESHLDGDPIVVFDELAGRWVLSQFALSFPSDFHECIAVSKTSDPTGQWYRYDFRYQAPGAFNDYPKIGVWPDGYYMSANQFDGTTRAWAGAGATVFERSAMLLGQPARQVYFDLAGQPLSGMLPADVDGAPPPPGSPEIFAQIDDDAWGYPSDQLELWAFATNWTTPASSTFTKTGNVPVAAFDSALCSGSCIPQPGTTEKLDPLTDRLMYRLQYRNFGDHQVLVTSHTVNAAGHAAVRWYDVENSGSGWSVAQSGTYAPTGENRWMGSAAMNANGDLAIGYSVSGGGTYPSVRLAARLFTDPAGVLQAEATGAEGAGSQTGTDRWGDYTSMSVDPADGCTFWYAGEYYGATSGSGWRTRIVALRLPGCTGAGGQPGPGAAAVSGPSLGQAYQLSTSLDLDWSASGTGPLTYDVRYRRAAATGEFGTQVSWVGGAAATSGTFSAAPGSTYCFSARATDQQPKTGPWGAETCTAIPLDDRSLKATGSWSRKSGAGTYLGTFTVSSRRGDVLVARNLRASDLALVVTECSGCGSVRVLWNGVSLGTFSLGATVTKRSVVIPVASFGAARTGNLTVVVASANKPVKIEGLGISQA